MNEQELNGCVIFVFKTTVAAVAKLTPLTNGASKLNLLGFESRIL